MAKDTTKYFITIDGAGSFNSADGFVYSTKEEVLEDNESGDEVLEVQVIRKLVIKNDLIEVKK